MISSILFCMRESSDLLQAFSRIGITSFPSVRSLVLIWSNISESLSSRRRIMAFISVFLSCLVAVFFIKKENEIFISSSTQRYLRRIRKLVNTYQQKNV